LKFENFYEAMGDVPEGLTLDRTDNNRGYEPGNCSWENRVRQSQNRGTPKHNTTGCKGITVSYNRYQVRITVGGKRLSIGQFPLTEDGFQRAKAARLLAEDIYWGRSK
jgi:hypothetical protein